MSEAEPSAAEVALGRDHRGKRILVAEDHPLNRALMAELLAAAGLEVDMAANGIEAVAMAARTSYDLILMDVQMPKMNGLRAARAIRLLPGQGEVPIIAMTGRTLDEDRAAGEEAGINDYLVKPLRPDVLFAALLRWLQTKDGGDDAGSP